MKPILFNTEMVKAILDGRKMVTRRLIKYIPNNAEMVGTLIDSTMQEDAKNIGKLWYKVHDPGNTRNVYVKFPYKPGDILYVRETWEEWTGGYAYKVPDPQAAYNYPASFIGKWKPSLHMPKEAARVFLQVKKVKVERLQDITEEQAINEGISKMYDNTPDCEYQDWSRRVCQGKKKEEWPYSNYLWHGNFGSCGNGNKLSDAWYFQCSGYESAIGSFSSLWNTTVKLSDWNTYGWYANPWVWVIEFERISKEEAYGRNTEKD